MMGYSAKGEPIWFTSQERPTITVQYNGYRSDAWRIAGDSIHYIYRDDDMDALATGSISAKTGGMSFPRPLIETSMTALNRHTKWLGDKSALMVLYSLDDYRLVRFSY